MNSKEIVGIYVRLSEEDRNKQNKDDDSMSIQNQKSMLINFAMERGWDIYKIYSDDDYAGADRNRPEFKRLLEDAEHKKFNIVLCKSQSRFTRELEIVEKYIHGYFTQWGIRFIGMVDNADTSIKGNKKARQINGLVNEWYLEDLSENIKGVLTDRRENGFHIGAFALYGYQKDLEVKGHLLPDPTAAEIVKEVFRLYAGGLGKIQIARELNAREIPNPSEYRRKNGIATTVNSRQNSTLWRYSTIGSMLENEMYIGNMVQGKYHSISYKSKQNKPTAKEAWIRVEGTHEPIIDIELWDKVQMLLALKSKPFDITGETGLFARKTRCMYCGYTMIQKKNRQYRYLDCGTKYASKNACTGGFIPVRELERRVLDEVKNMTALYLDEDRAETLIKIRDTHKENLLNLKMQIRQYEKKNADLKKALSRLYLDKINEIISEQEYIDYADSFRKEQAKYSAILTTMETELQRKNQQQEQQEITKKEILQKYTHLYGLNRDIILTLIDYIEIGKRRDRTVDVPIIIHWTF